MYICVYMYIHRHRYICIALYALRDSAEATKAWRMMAWCKGCEVPSFWCHWLSLRAPWGSFGVLGRSWWVLGVSQDYLGCPWSSWVFVEGPWGIIEKSGAPQGASEIENHVYRVS